MAEAQFRTLLIHDREQLVFAVEAAGRIVARILRSRHLISDDNIERNLPPLGEFDRELQLMPGQAWRVGKHRQHVLAENFMRGPGEKRRVRPTRIGDQ